MHFNSLKAQGVGQWAFQTVMMTNFRPTIRLR